METGALDVGAIRALTFDCYGTLIDWDTGVRRALSHLPSLEGCDTDRLLQERHRAEREVEAEAYRSYAEVLAESLRRAAEALGRSPSGDELVAFADSLRAWPPFEESPAALARLAARFPLGILSNVDTDVLRSSVQLLGAPFEVLVTAEEVRSYKPARPHFDEGLRRLGLERDAVLHVAQSYYHDVRPTRELGWSCVWVNRLGEARPDGPAPTWEVADLSDLCAHLGV